MFEYLTWITANIVLASNSLFADIKPAHEQLQVPQCLAAKITTAHDVLAENDQFKIIDLLNSEVKQITLLANKVKCGDFVTVSDKVSGTVLEAKKLSARNILQKSAVQSVKKDEISKEVYEIKHQNAVKTALKEVVADNIWQSLNHLTSYKNRSATTETGVAAANWLKATFEAMAVEYSRSDTQTFFVKAGWYQQPSLVTVIGKDIKAPAIVIGAHMDTLEGTMPGADEGSGSVTIMETARVLLASKTKFKHPIYIVWYAAGNKELAGSKYVVQYFEEHSIPVKAVLQLDKTGYRVNAEDPTMWIFTDHTNKSLNEYIAKLIKIYVQVPMDYSLCGFECSDHASWNEEGIKAAFPSESKFEKFNPYIGSSSDTMDLLNLDHMTNFSKLALAFAIEMGSE